jgi:hypothetical protein
MVQNKIQSYTKLDKCAISQAEKAHCKKEKKKRKKTTLSMSRFFQSKKSLSPFLHQKKKMAMKAWINSSIHIVRPFDVQTQSRNLLPFRQHRTKFPTLKFLPSSTSLYSSL